MRTAVRIVVMSLVAGVLSAVPVHAQEDGEVQRTRQVESLAPAVARDLGAAYEDLRNDRTQQALSKLNQLMSSRGDSMKPFDKASVLQIRGSAFASLGRHGEALRDFESALQLDALPAEQNLQLRFNVAQLHFQEENYGEAIRYFQQWLDDAEAPDANACYMLAAAHYYRDDYRAAVPHIERALSLAKAPKQRFFDLANIVFAELNLRDKRVRLLERIIEHWPDQVTYWKQLAATYNELDRQREAFATLELAYRNGLLGDEADIVSLAQFYSRFNNPHRGAELLIKEMEAGRVTRDVEHLELLSQLWSQAREHKKAIPVLREAARLSDTGGLAFRLGQVLFADEQYPAAETALENALNKGGLTESDRADAWLLLGTARFNQAGPGDREQRAEADEAYQQAQRFGRTRSRAGEWRSYIAAINNTENRQAALEAEQEANLERAAEQRALTACRAQRLSGADVSERCRQLLESDASAQEQDAASDAASPSGEGDSSS